MKHLTSYNILIVLFASVGSLLTGYLSGTSGTTLGQTTFYTTLKLAEDPTSPNYAKTNQIISTANGLYYAGGFFGSILTGFLARKLGALMNFRICATVAFVGTVIQAASVDQPMYLVSRFITGMGSAQILAAMPPYYSEIADPKTRGLITGMQGVMLNVGYAVVAFVGFGCYFDQKSSFGWRFPVALGCLFCILLFIASFLLPQSPRWLVAQDRDDEALAVLIRLHGGSGEGDDFARREIALIRIQFNYDKEQIIRDGRWQIFTKKTYLKRVLLALMVLCGSQDLGILVIFNYQVILFKSLGISATVSQLLPAIYEVVATLGNLIGAGTSDRLGRRRALRKLWRDMKSIAC
jgi:MFS family permease